MKDRREEIIAALEANLSGTEAFFKALTPEQLETSVHQDEAAWNARQVLAHFVTIEGSMHRLFRDILDGGPGSPPDFDVDRYNLSQVKKLDGLTAAELIDRFRAVRTETIAIVAGMAEADLDREGRHAFHGPGKLERFVRWAGEHVDLHLADISRELKVR